MKNTIGLSVRGDDERKECLETVRTLSGAARTAHDKGLLALDGLREKAQRAGDAFLADALAYLLDGPPPELFEKLLYRLLTANGTRTLRDVLTAEALLTICRGDFGGNVLALELASWFGAGWYDAVDEAAREGWERAGGHLS